MTAQQKGVAAGSSGLRFTVREGVTASATVNDASGSPIANGRVTLKPTGREDLGQTSSRTNGDGTFTAAGLEEGVTYEVSIMRRVENAWKTVTAGTIKGGETGITLQAAE